jgi:F0F1-type ATP synthase epsilon subunit
MNEASSANNAIANKGSDARKQAVNGNYGAQATAAKPYLSVKIYSPFRVYFEGQAKSVSAESSTGPFDILPHHHNFITLLLPCNVIVRTDRGDQTIRIQGGMMHVKSDEITVFLDV